VFFSESGSVAVEVAMKMAVQYWINRGQRGRTRLVAFRGGYHGDTTGAMAVCDPEEGMHALFRGLLPEHLIVDLPETERSAAAFERALNSMATASPASSVSRWCRAPADAVPRWRDLAPAAGRRRPLRRAADLRRDLHRLRRTGTMFACEAAAVVPDIITLGKALTGGRCRSPPRWPRRAVFEAFWSDDPGHALMHGPTFMGNALACAAANASLDLFEQEPRLRQVADIQAAARRRPEPCRGLAGVKDVRVKGAIRRGRACAHRQSRCAARALRGGGRVRPAVRLGGLSHPGLPPSARRNSPADCCCL